MFKESAIFTVMECRVSDVDVENKTHSTSITYYKRTRVSSAFAAFIILFHSDISQSKSTILKLDSNN